MKIAGQKNPGAWYRNNVAINALSSDERTALQTRIRALDTINNAYNALVALATETGVQAIPHAATEQEWVSAMTVNGIPLQIWMGKLTFTTYAKVDGKYAANYQGAIHYFARDLRKTCKRFFLAKRQIRDVFDSGDMGDGNPGGNPDGPYKANA